MAMSVNTNISAMNSQRHLTNTDNAMQKSLEKLSSGYRINRAADDAAGLAISEKMRGQVKGLNQASRNAQDGISLLQTAEGALNETHSILQRMRELSVQGANDTLAAEDRNAINTELTQLAEEITRIGNTTQFNGKNLLDGSFGVKLDSATSTLKEGVDGVTSISVNGAQTATTYTITQGAAGQVSISDGATTQTLTGLAASYTGTLNFDQLGVQLEVVGADLSGVGTWSATTKTVVTGAAADAKLQIGANAGQTLGITVDDMRAANLGVNALNVNDSTTANAATTALDTAINQVSEQRSTLGAWQNRLEHTINNLGTSAENLTAAESRIRDVDMAKEMSEFTKNQVLSQAGVSMLAQANQSSQSILKLLG